MQNDPTSCGRRSFVRRFIKGLFSLTFLSVIPFSPIVMIVESPVIDRGEKEEITGFAEPVDPAEETVDMAGPAEPVKPEPEAAAQPEKGGNQPAAIPEKRYEPTEEELKLLARTVYSEARGEDFKGQIAVAAVVLNRLESKDFPNDIKGVIFQPKAFTAIRDGQFWLEPDERSFLAVEEALKGEDPSGGALYYYNPRAVTSEWIFTRTVVKSIGNHQFAI